MSSEDCSLWMLAAEPDIPFLPLTVPHLIRSCNFPFGERVLALDTAPLSGDYARRPKVPVQASLEDCCTALLSEGIVDRVVYLEYSRQSHRRLYRKYFGDFIPQTHGYRGYPVLGSMMCLEQAEGNYMVHFDSDMLLHQSPEHSWVSEGIRLLEEHDDVISVMPLPGPPGNDGRLHQSVPYQADPRGFFSFKNFSSRVYLIDRRRFEKLLPLEILALGSHRPLFKRFPDRWRLMAQHFLGRNVLYSFEVMVTHAMQESSFVRADLDSNKAWTLHPPDHGVQFLEKLPEIIARVEGGSFPERQAGHYDLKLDLW